MIPRCAGHAQVKSLPRCRIGTTGLSPSDGVRRGPSQMPVHCQYPYSLVSPQTRRLPTTLMSLTHTGTTPLSVKRA